MVGSRCGARLKCCMTGGPFWAKSVSSIASAGCRYESIQKESVSDDAWRSDWPAIPTDRLTPSQQRASMTSRTRQEKPFSEICFIREHGTPPPPPPPHQHLAHSRKNTRFREAALDQTIEASFSLCERSPLFFSTQLSGRSCGCSRASARQVKTFDERAPI